MATEAFVTEMVTECGFIVQQVEELGVPTSWFVVVFEREKEPCNEGRADDTESVGEFECS
jgi:hypothetical protein